jgi:hypothetical protein
MASHGTPMRISSGNFEILAPYKDFEALRPDVEPIRTVAD